MTVDELVNALRTHPGDMEVLVGSDEELWQLTLGSFREATLQGTAHGDIVEPSEYDPQVDGAITDTRDVLLIDLDL